MSQLLTIHRKVHLRQHGRQKCLCRGPAPQTPTKTERRPHVARLMALAIHLEELVENDTVRDYAALARLGRVSRARITQIMNLRCLAPDIQEAILFLPAATTGRDKITERHLRPIAAELDWGNQRQMWQTLAGEQIRSQ